MNDHEDMIEAVRASVNQLSEAPEAPEEKAAPVEAAPEQSESERARDEKGRFVASEEKSEEKIIEPVKQATPEAPVAPVVDSTPQLKPPTSWSSEARNEWSKLSPTLQQAVLKREDEISKGSQEYSNDRQRLKALEGIIAPRRDHYQRFGFKDDAQAINHLFTLSDSMERDPRATIAYLAQHYGVDLTTGGQPPPTQQPQQQPLPDIDKKVAEAIEVHNAKMTVREFEANPPEHYQEVKPLMKVLLESGQASGLQDAYEQAIWAKPDIRNRVQEAQQAKAQQELAAKAAIKVVQKTKAANASLTGAPHGAASATPDAKANGKFGEVANDVRAAMASLM